MSRPLRIPKYRRHATGQAFVQYKGKRKYLGRYGTEESKRRYRYSSFNPANRSVTDPCAYHVGGNVLIRKL